MTALYVAAVVLATSAIGTGIVAAAVNLIRRSS